MSLVNDASEHPYFATITTSHPEIVSIKEKTFRSRLLTKFLVTALPTRFPTANPSREYPNSFRDTITFTNREEYRLPNSKT